MSGEETIAALTDARNNAILTVVEDGEEIGQITRLLCDNLAKRCKEQMNITLRIGKEMRDLLSQKGYDVKYGARPLRRAVLTMVEDPLSEEILKGNIKEHDKVSVRVKDGKALFVTEKK